LKIGIVGDTSALGSKLKDAFSTDGHQLYLWNRNVQNENIHSFHFSIEDTHQAITIPELDVIFILAWKQSPRTAITAKQNIETFTKLLKACKANSVKVVFVSTLGAIGISESWHIKAKKSVEALLGGGDVILRPASIVSADTNLLIGNVSWINSLNLPFRIQTKPPLYISTVSESVVIEECLEVISGFPVESKKPFPKEINLVSEVKVLQIGGSSFGAKKFQLNQSWLNIIFKLLNKTKIPIFIEIYDKWLAILTVQDFNIELYEQDLHDYK
jgi:hypothetical protein